MSTTPEPQLPDIFHPRPDTVYPLETIARLAGVERRTVLIYCRHGMLRPVQQGPEESWMFADEDVRVIRQIERLRTSHDINLPGIRIILELSERITELEREVRFLREAGR